MNFICIKPTNIIMDENSLNFLNRQNITPVDCYVINANTIWEKVNFKNHMVCLERLDPWYMLNIRVFLSKEELEEHFEITEKPLQHSTWKLWGDTNAEIKE